MTCLKDTQMETPASRAQTHPKPPHVHSGGSIVSDCDPMNCSPPGSSVHGISTQEHPEASLKPALVPEQLEGAPWHSHWKCHGYSLGTTSFWTRHPHWAHVSEPQMSAWLPAPQSRPRTPRRLCPFREQDLGTDPILVPTPGPQLPRRN